MTPTAAAKKYYWMILTHSDPLTRIIQWSNAFPPSETPPTPVRNPEFFVGFPSAEARALARKVFLETPGFDIDNYASEHPEVKVIGVVNPEFGEPLGFQPYA